MGSSTTDYATIALPQFCIADFCLIPIGTSSASVSKEITSIQKLMRASGLNYTMHSAGTTVEGSWSDVMNIIGQAHSLIHQNGGLRVQTDIRVGTRVDKVQKFSDKVSKVESLLSSSASSQ